MKSAFHLIQRLTVLKIFAAAMIISSSLSAATFYVDPATGSNANNGSASSPWRTLEEVFTSGKIESRNASYQTKNAGAPVKAGDTIVLRSGYHGRISQSGWHNTDYITVAAEDGHTPELQYLRMEQASRWIFRGLSVSQTHAGITNKIGHLVEFSNGAQYITFEDSHVFSATSPWTTTSNWLARASDGIYVPASRITIRNNRVENVYRGIYLMGSNNLAEYNTVQNFGADAMRGSGSDNTFQYNQLLDCYKIDSNHDDGIQWYSGSNNVYRNVLRGNLIMNQTSSRPLAGSMQGIGCFDDAHYNWTVENNVIITNHWNGLALYHAINCQVVNNTVINVRYLLGQSSMTSWIDLGQKSGRPAPSGTIVRNNLANTFDIPSGNTGDHNITITPSNHTQYFVNSSNLYNPDLHLKGGSPAIDAGSASLAPLVDFDFKSRPIGAAFDVGAYEFGEPGLTANAGPDQTVIDNDDSGSEPVTLDGSGSFDDGTIVSFSWSEGGSQIATGATPTVQLSVGNHTIELMVTDNDGETDTDTVEIKVLQPGVVISTDGWQNFSFANQTGAFTFECDTTPHVADMDGVFGISSGIATDYDHLACIIRYYTNGMIQARNGGVYMADAAVPYSADTEYHIRMEIDLAAKTYDVFVTPDGGSQVMLADNYAFRTEQSGVTNLNHWSIHHQSPYHSVYNVRVYTGPTVVGRHIFYNNSAFDGQDAAADAADDNAIATDKSALMPGQTATFANYTSYDKGINGIMIDMTDGPASVSAADFEFKAGNNSIPDGWTTVAASVFKVRPGAGVDGSDRITIIFPGRTIRKQWLQVTFKANANTGLSSDDVFYFGNAVGETGNSSADTNVNAIDEINCRNNPRHFLNPAEVTDVHDFNRDGKVNASDEIIARNNTTTLLSALRLLDAP